MTKILRYAMPALILVMLLSGCEYIPGLGGETAEPPLLELMPDLPDYDVVEGESLTGYISTLAEGAALLAAQPELAAAMAGVDQIIGCYQEVGALKARIYSHKETPMSAGVIAMADRDALLNPVNLFKCATASQDEGMRPQMVQLEPCVNTYTLERDGNEFYILYAGTTAEICETFCSHLEGCVQN